jgi:hypothetical protein
VCERPDFLIFETRLRGPPALLIFQVRLREPPVFIDFFKIRAGGKTFV